MADYCGAYPNRLGGVILAGARDVDGALAEIHRWGRSSWAWGPGRRQGRIVTGDASGIGAACAMTLAREGAKVVVTDMDDPGCQAIVNKSGSTSGEAIFLHQDVSIEEAGPGVIKATERRFGPLDAMVANAGTGIRARLSK